MRPRENWFFVVTFAVGGLQRNGTLRSSTIKKVAPPVVPDVVGGGTAGRRHSSASPTSSASLYGALPGTPDPRASLQGSPGFALPGNAVDNASQPPPSPSPGYGGPEEKMSADRLSYPDWPREDDLNPFSPYFLPLDRRSHSWVDLCGGTSQGVLCHPSVRRHDDDSVSHKGERISRRKSTVGVFRKGLRLLRRSFSAENGFKLGVAHRLSTGSHGSSGSLTLTSSVGSHMSSLTPEVVVLSPLNVAGLLVNGVSVSVGSFLG
ncbi:hypothetical protein IscW_ISCW018234 [Ixodes scapularis]|uniref:Uncharacterized protein n=1 Tax=Ixodes scapularis TaxID=6945 RepID=B7PHP2_IXOSC|nr:hypothetical protein IscW_ISCW018234 [Ixodes scapularis]|eukprot:XP_002403362.1 hypothetical protein IscW_ISCW018234 [Ixodes scapularis]